ncbi:hypothetical protein BDZ88DRAFT_442812 [Geranomyces variabilis]|nr:hypothetical protein BDZ88DRAFT_442812 [Geranomyces variabilis]KAJ3131145.1 hypothetical protein HDU90_008694 [Geranomyces variabilis]
MAAPAAQSWREKCFSTFSFRNQEDVPAAAELYDYTTMLRDGQEHKMSAFAQVDKFRIWSDLAVAYTLNDFRGLADLQDGGGNVALDTDTAGAKGIPQDEADWERLYNELTLLTKSFCHVSSCFPPRTDGKDKCWNFGDAGGANCPLLLPALSILNDPVAADDEVSANLCTTLGLPESLHRYYYINRIAIDDEEAAASFLFNVRAYPHFCADDDPYDGDEQDTLRTRNTALLRAALADQGYQELIHLRVQDPDRGEYQGGWSGSFCEFVLVSHSSPGWRVLGVLVYRDCNA